MTQANAPLYKLVMMPFDADFDFLEELGRNAKTVYKESIESFEIMPRIDLPKNALSIKGDEISDNAVQMAVRQIDTISAAELLRHYNAGEKLVYVNDMVEQMLHHAVPKAQKIHLAIIPYFLYSDTIVQSGASIPESGFAIMSTYGPDEKDAKIGVALQEVGNVIAGRHATTEYEVERVNP